MTPAVDVESRESVPRWLDYGAPLLTILSALLVASIPLLWIGANPILVYDQIFFASLLGIGGIADVLTTATPLFLAGLAVYIPLKAGLWNIGAEGQMYVGAVVGTYIGLNYGVSTYLLLPLMTLMSGLAGALYGAIPGYLRAEHNVNEIISSLMLTFAATTFVGYLLRGPLQGRGGQTATNSLPDAAELPTVLHPRLHIGVGVLALAAVFGGLLLTRTRLGYEITFMGSNPAAAKQAGISSYKIYILVFLISGFFAGLAGIIEIAGVHGRLFESFSPGYGFTAIAVALLGRSGVSRVLLAGLFFGILTAGGTTVAISMDVPNALIDVIVALTILFLLTAEFIKDYRVVINSGGESDVDSEPSVEGSA